MFEIKRGTHITFRNGDDVLEGVVNGIPYVIAYEDDDGMRVQARMSVYVHAGGKVIDIAGENILAVQSP